MLFKKEKIVLWFIFNLVYISLFANTNELPDKFRNINVNRQNINNDKVIDELDKKKNLSEKKESQSMDRIAIMGEFGLGNIGSIYGAYNLGPLYLGTGLGYYYYEDKENEDSINVFEPAILAVKHFKLNRFNMLITRIRVGIDLITENRFGLSGQTVCISSDVMINIKGIYAGISMPIIIGSEGTSIIFSIGAGYIYMISF